MVKTRSGGRQRLARNMLVLVSADAGALAEARKAAKLLMAWRSILKDEKTLDLKSSQLRDVNDQIEHGEHALTTSVHRAWSQVLVPGPRRAQDGQPFDLERTPLRNAAGKTVAQAAWESVVQSSAVLERFGQLGLADRLKANWPAGADHVPLATIRDWFVQYVAFERLRDESVRADALADLVAMNGGYAYAAGVDADDRYEGLVLPGKGVAPRFDGESVLVTKEAADRQTGEAPPPGGARDGPRSGDEGRDGTGTGPDQPTGGPAPARVLRRFFGSVELDPTRPIPELQKSWIVSSPS